MGLYNYKPKKYNRYYVDLMRYYQKQSRTQQDQF
jgi:hypothetical protein